MLVSCICVCHNKPDLAHEAIESIVAQSHANWEALIVDSGVLYDAGYYDQFSWRCDPRVKLIRSEETEITRQTKAMAPWCFNECFRKGLVRGDLVMYLCDDDLLYPNAFATFVAYSRQNPQAKAMYASQDLGVIDPSGRRAIVGERRATEVGGRSCNGRSLDCQVDYLQFCHKPEVLKFFPDDEYWPESKESEAHADGLFMERVGEFVSIFPIDVKVSQNRRTPQSIYDPATDWQTEALNWRQQYLLNQSFLQSLSQSLPWKILKPVRALRRVLRPRGFSACNLLPWDQLERDGEDPQGAWLATGGRPCFVVPCELPAGWLRVRVLLSSDTKGRFEILACGGNGISDVEPVLQAEVRGGLDLVEYVYVSRPMLGMQINPLGAAGRFQIKALEVVPIPRHRATPGTRRDKSDGYIAAKGAIAGLRKQPDASDRLEVHTPSRDAEYPRFNFPDEPSVDWSVIIPTINDAQKVVHCIKSCRQHLRRGLNVEFLVVDDGTPDARDLQELERAAADLEFRLLVNHQNLGFSASVNHGMRLARGRYILLCNNDILFFQPCLEAFAHAFDADSEVGIVGAKLLYPQGTLQHAGMDKVPGQLRWIHSFHEFPADHPSACASRYVWSVTGALVALRRETLQRLGGLSNAYANAYEDLDYCLHAWTHGIRVAYCPQAVAIHEECGTRGTTRKQKDKRPLFWSERERAGRQYFEKKWQALREIESFETLWIQAAS